MGQNGFFFGFLIFKCIQFIQMRKLKFQLKILDCFIFRKQVLIYMKINMNINFFYKSGWRDNDGCDALKIIWPRRAFTAAANSPQIDRTLLRLISSEQSYDP